MTQLSPIGVEMPNVIIDDIWHEPESEYSASTAMPCARSRHWLLPVTGSPQNFLPNKVVLPSKIHFSLCPLAGVQ